MISRAPLILLESNSRTPLRLLQEIDAPLRRAERAFRTNPGDPQARQQHRALKKRAGPPDQEHNWRFNGKGWFTRPGWNNGRCPENSEPTQHNTCINPDGPDRQHYQTKADDHPNPQKSTPHARRWKRRAELERTPEVENSPLSIKRGSRVNWEHPLGPRIYEPYEGEKPRPLPDNPEHLPRAFASPLTGHLQNWRRQEDKKEREKLTQHYVGKGYDEKYVRSALGPREPEIDAGSLSDTNLARLPPERLARVRALRKKGAKDWARREAERAEHAANVQHHIDHFGGPPEGGEDDDDNDLADDYYDRDWDDEEPIGGYKEHPGYPGHPDYPQFDAYPSKREDQPKAPPRRRFSWEPEPPPPPEDPDSQFVGPTARHGEPPWPRTGQRPGRDWEDH